MQKLSQSQFQVIYYIIDEQSEINNNYHALIKVLGPGNKEHWLHAESKEDLECAAENLWRKMCLSEMIESPDCKMYFVSEDAAFVSDGIYGALHPIFDHGKSSFMNVMWYELQQDITEAFKESNNWNLNGWTIESAVEEMVSLWQTGSCENMPWEISGDWQFISEEFNDVVSIPPLH